MTIRQASVSTIAGVVAGAMLIGGCAARPNAVASTSRPATSTTSRALLSLDELSPQVTLDIPCTQPTTQPSLASLQAYAQGRDAMLRNKRQEAIDKFNQTVELDPDRSQVLRDLGYCYVGTDNDHAFNTFHRAVELDPNDTDSRIELARLYIVRGEIDSALIQLRKSRLTNDYQSNLTTQAVVDALLARVLDQQGYSRAAVDLYEDTLTRIERPGHFNAWRA